MDLKKTRLDEKSETKVVARAMEIEAKRQIVILCRNPNNVFKLEKLLKKDE